MRLNSHSETGLEENPLFRKVVTPWYDSSLTCCLSLAVLVGLAFFGWAGMQVARSNPFYSEYVWVPALLIILCLGVAGSVLIRLVRRFYERYLQTRDF